LKNLPLKPYWQLLSKYLKPQKGRVALLATLILIVIGLRVANPQIIRYYLDAAQVNATTQQLLIAAGLFLAFAFAVQFLSVAVVYLGEVVGWTATNNLRADLALHSLRLDMSFHNNKTPGEMIERIDGDVMDLAIFFSQLVIRVAGNLILLLAVLIAFFLEDWRVGVAMLIFSVLALLTMNRLRSIAVPHWKNAREAHANLYGFLEEQLGGMEDIRSSGAGNYVLDKLYRFGRAVTKMETIAGVRGMLVWMAFQSWHAIGYIIAFVAGYLLYTNGVVTLGTAYLLIYYTDTVFEPLRHLTQEIEHFQKAAGSIARLNDLLAIKSQIDDNGTTELPTGPLRLTFDDVTFGYAEDDPVLQNVSFDLAPGRVLGVLGRTGSGKTTLARLIFRLYEVTSGAVRITPTSTSPQKGRGAGEGLGVGDATSVLRAIDIRDVPLRALPKRIGMVTQDVQIFRGTVRQNLTLFDSTIPDARVIAVIRDLELSDWFDGLPKGLDSELEGGGKGLSAGEAQLLAFARVFLRNPGLVILDEASSRLDPATERRIERAIDKLLNEPKRTALIIAHRLATLHRADDILILERGGVVEQGERVALMRDANSRFSQLLRSADLGLLTEEDSAVSARADIEGIAVL
jgi:ABC-type multidrug transport system fused ATPase/permease subunit